MRHRPAFTLRELLVVMVIISLVAVVTLPTVLPAIQHRQVSEAARILQAAIEGAKDRAIRSGKPSGIRLLPDPAFPGTAVIPMLAASRIVPIEPAGDYFEGMVSIRPRIANRSGVPGAGTAGAGAANSIEECRFAPDGTPNPRTSWYWNVRVGDRIQIGGAGTIYTIVGPEVTPNAERFVNVGPPGPIPGAYDLSTVSGSEYLFVVNGVDDNGNGYVDEGADGADNDDDGLDEDGDGVIDANGDGLIDRADPGVMDPGNPYGGGEWEDETALPTAENIPYRIFRRPYPTPGARAIELPEGVVIDLTGWAAAIPERSRLPVDPDSFHVDIMVGPNGQVVPSGMYSGPAKFGAIPFYEFVLAERSDVHPPVTIAGVPYTLPMPEGTANYPAAADVSPRYLKGDRRVLTMNPRTGFLTVNPGDSFDGADRSAMFYAGRGGVRTAD